MRRGQRSVSATLTILVAVGTAGCGSGGGGPKYGLVTTRTCLDREGLHAVPDHNTVLAGSQGNLRVEFGYGSPMVFMVFGKDSVEATQIANHAVAAAQNSTSLGEKTIRAGIQQTGNVFYYSDTGPLTQAARSKIAACLH